MKKINYAIMALFLCLCFSVSIFAKTVKGREFSCFIINNDILDTYKEANQFEIFMSWNADGTALFMDGKLAFLPFPCMLNLVQKVNKEEYKMWIYDLANTPYQVYYAFNKHDIENVVITLYNKETLKMLAIHAVASEIITKNYPD